ncbi:NFACT family protein [Candidatus Micrarchaeota archaeon]|nr:NFACT family protein [Candidatus Micrarchaeota archaeon]
MVSLIELKFIVEYIKKRTLNKRISKIYIDKDNFIFKINGNMLFVMLPTTISITQARFKIPFKLTNMATFLRKRLTGQIINEIELVNSDRIVRISTGKYLIYIELFSKGNLILCNKENKILIAKRYEERKGRSIKKNNKYLPPVNIKPIDFSNSSEVYNVLATHIKKTDSFEKALTIMGINPEVVKFHNNEKYTIVENNQISDENIKTIAEIIARLWNSEPSDKYVEKIITESNKKILNIIASSTASSEKIKKLSRIISEQKKKISESEDDIEKINSKIDFILNNYETIERILRMVKHNPDGIKNIENELNWKVKIKYPNVKIEIEKKD